MFNSLVPMGLTVREDPAHQLFREPASRPNPIVDGKTLICDWQQEHNKLRFTFINPPLAPQDGGAVRCAGPTEIQKALEELAEMLKEISEIRFSGPSGQLAQQLQLQGKGSILFEKLLAPEVRRQIESWPDDSWVTISTNETWIPWELLHDGKGFLAHRFMLFRVPRPSSDLNSRTPAAPAGCRIKREKQDLKIVNVIGGDLEQHVEACRTLFDGLAGRASVTSVIEKLVADLVSAFANADVIHLTCHGHRAPLRLQVAKDAGISVSLTVDTVRTLPVPPGCLVFANACNSGTAHPFFDEFVSFGWEFYLKGATFFIGTLGPVPTDDALAFAKAFYRALQESTDADVIVAYRQAKSAASKDRPTQLLYCFYGNPNQCPKLHLH